MGEASIQHRTECSIQIYGIVQARRHIIPITGSTKSLWARTATNNITTMLALIEFNLTHIRAIERPNLFISMANVSLE